MDHVVRAAIPLDDLVAHEHSPSCVCGPVVVPIVRGDGWRLTSTIHRRLDGQPAVGEVGGR